MTAPSVRNQAYKLRITRDLSWPDGLVDDLRQLYARAGRDGVLGLDTLVHKWGKSRANLCRTARDLGLTNQRRKKVEVRKDPRKFKGDNAAARASIGAKTKERFANGGHPRGMLGKRHTPEVREHLGKTSKRWWGSLSAEEKDAQVTSNLKAALAKNGRIGGPSENREGATWKAGWREIADRRIYFRSRWEANYARYLQWLKERGDLLDWEYEPETFWFDAIKRGVRSYKPDFRVHELNGDKPFHEVKGWMDARSKTTLKRMAKYHPHETVIVVREKEYRAIARFSAMIPGWEYSGRTDRP
jgi:hypothetical protein